MRIWGESKKLCLLMDGMQLEIIPWGNNSLRVIMLPVGSTDNRNWALTEAVPDMEPEITVIIIDDDLGSIQKLQNDLLAFSEVRILDTATTAELGKRHILKYQPDLVFLDVELPDMSGFDLLDDIRDDILPNLRVVFYTVYDKYILDALRASAFDYLLKPYLIDELAALIERFHTTEPADVACMERSLRKILNRDSRFAIQTVSGLLLVRCEEIFLFQFLGDQRCWQIVLTSRTTHKLKMSTTAKDLLSINNTFVQISQDCIVNLTYLMFIENKTLRCEFYPPFQEEERIASHRYFKQLRERLDII